MIKEIAFAGYPVTDMKRAREFYENIFDLKADNEIESDEGSWTEYNIGKEGCFLLGKHEGWNPSNDGPQAAFEVDNYDEVLDRLRKRNVKFLFEDMDFPSCKMTIAYDPDGNTFTLHQRKS